MEPKLQKGSSKYCKDPGGLDYIPSQAIRLLLTKEESPQVVLKQQHRYSKEDRHHSRHQAFRREALHESPGHNERLNFYLNNEVIKCKRAIKKTNNFFELISYYEKEIKKFFQECEEDGAIRESIERKISANILRNGRLRFNRESRPESGKPGFLNIESIIPKFKSFRNEFQKKLEVAGGAQQKTSSSKNIFKTEPGNNYRPKLSSVQGRCNYPQQKFVGPATGTMPFSSPYHCFTNANKSLQKCEDCPTSVLSEPEIKLNSNLLAKSNIVESQHHSLQKERKEFKYPLKRVSFFQISLQEAYRKRKQANEDSLMEYRDFLWKVCFSFELEPYCCRENARPYRCFVGSGNNSPLIKSVIRKRVWWSITQNMAEAQFVWTQLKISSLFKSQKSHEVRALRGLKAVPVSKNCAAFELELKLLTNEKAKAWQDYICRNYKNDYKFANFKNRLPFYKQFECQKPVVPSGLVVHNHLELNYILGNKKALYYTLKEYCSAQKYELSQFVPLTFHISKGFDDPEYSLFLSAFNRRAKQLSQLKRLNLWIVKPGELTNRGQGISVCDDLKKVKQILKAREQHSNGKAMTYILQEYLDRPLLYNRRKFDIRHYMLVVSMAGSMKGYWYEEGYIRTTSSEFDLFDLSAAIHLTNDAVQKHLPDYGKLQPGNKLSYADFQKYVCKESKGSRDFQRDILPKMKEIATHLLRASMCRMDPQRLGSNFEIFGLDFMVDAEFKPWLIEVNTNPCLELSSPVLAKLIPAMLDNALRIGLDPLFWPSEATMLAKKNSFSEPFERNRFVLILDQLCEGQRSAQFEYDQALREQVASEEEEQFEDSPRGREPDTIA